MVKIILTLSIKLHEMKRTLIIGASANPSRYAYIATQRLISYGHPVFLVGRKNGIVLGQEIQTEKIYYSDIHTVTLYINPTHQPDYYDYIVSLNPKRVIFNPGTENPDFENILSAINIIPIRACTLLLLSVGQY